MVESGILLENIINIDDRVEAYLRFRDLLRDLSSVNPKLSFNDICHAIEQNKLHHGILTLSNRLELKDFLKREGNMSLPQVDSDPIKLKQIKGAISKLEKRAQQLRVADHWEQYLRDEKGMETDEFLFLVQSESGEFFGPTKKGHLAKGLLQFAGGKQIVKIIPLNISLTPEDFTLLITFVNMTQQGREMNTVNLRKIFAKYGVPLTFTPEKKSTDIFIDDLDKQFASWGATEKKKDGKT
nr:hypothetical protein [Candidatus Sigynarchaeota archaeon]